MAAGQTVHGLPGEGHPNGSPSLVTSGASLTGSAESVAGRVTALCDPVHMRVTHLSARGLLSFGKESFTLNLAESGPSVLVGPNASGKSNLGTLVDLVVTAVAWSSAPAAGGYPAGRSRQREVLVEAARSARHRGLPEGTAVEARLGIKLTRDVERELVTSFMRAVIASSSGETASQRKPSVESWALGLPTDAFTALFRGELVVSHSGVAGSDWRVCFEPADKIAETDVAVLMNSYNAMLVRRGEAPPPHRLSDLGVMLGFESDRGNTVQTAPGNPPDPGAVLGHLVPEPGSATVLLVHCPASTPEQLPEATRVFLRRASLEASLQPNSLWGPGVVWERILRQGVRHLRAQGAALSAFDDAGLPAGQWVYSADALAEPAGAEITDLPRSLWELHNAGPASAGRLRSVHEEFAELAPGWEFAVAGRLEPSARPAEPVPLQLAVEASTGAGSLFAMPYRPVHALPAGSAPERSELDVALQVQLFAHRTAGSWEPLAGAGTGVVQALLLADALSDQHEVAVRVVSPSTPQALLVEAFGRRTREVFAVGDPAQAIYGFRGADLGNILAFGRRYPEATIYEVATNYRSTQNILDATSSMLAAGRGQMRVAPVAHTHEVGSVTTERYATSALEAEAVAARVGQMSEAGVARSEIAVLYRVNALSRSVESAFLRHEVPYRVVGGMRFFDRREVKDVLAWVRLAIRRDDVIAWSRAAGAAARAGRGSARGDGRPRRGNGCSPFRRREPRRAPEASRRGARLRITPRGGLQGPGRGGDPHGEPRRARSHGHALRRRGCLRRRSGPPELARRGRRRGSGVVLDDPRGQGPGVARSVHPRPGGRHLPPW